MRVIGRTRTTVLGVVAAAVVVAGLLAGGATALVRAGDDPPPAGALVAEPGADDPGAEAPGVDGPGGEAPGADAPDADGAGGEPVPRNTSAPQVRRPGQASFDLVPSSVDELDPRRPGLGQVDVYVPRAGIEGVSRGRLPVVVLLGGRDVHPSQYEQLAHEVAAYGVAVLVPERLHGARAVQAARAWAARYDRARPGRFGVLAVGAAELEASRGVAGVDLRAAYLPDDDGTGAELGARPALVVAGEAVDVTGSRAVVVRRPGATSLAVTDEGARGRTGQSPVPHERTEQIAATARWFGTWFAAQDRDRLSREFLAARVADPEPSSDGTTVTATGRLPW